MAEFVNNMINSVLVGKSDGRGLSDEESLLEELFGDYNPSARPVIDSSSTVPVQIQFSLMHIKDLVSSILAVSLNT